MPSVVSQGRGEWIGEDYTGLLTLCAQQLPVLVQVSQKEAVDKSRLPQAGLTWP